MRAARGQLLQHTARRRSTAARTKCSATSSRRRCSASEREGTDHELRFQRRRGTTARRGAALGRAAATASSAAARIAKAGGFSAEAWGETRRAGPARAWARRKTTAAWRMGPVDGDAGARGARPRPGAGAGGRGGAGRRLGARAGARGRARRAGRRASPSGEARVVLALPGARRALPAEPRRHEGRRTPATRGRSAAPRASCRSATRPTPSSCRARVSGAADDAARHRAVPGRTRAPPASTTQGYALQDGSRAAEVDARRRAGHAAGRRRPGLRRAGAGRRHRHRRAGAEAVGAMDKLFELTVDYMNTRKQFGVADRHLPGAAPPRRRHEDAARTRALDELLRDAQARRGAAPCAAARVAQAKVQLGQSDALRRPAVRSSCTAASA